MNAEELNTLKELCQDATPGPWVKNSAQGGAQVWAKDLDRLGSMRIAQLEHADFDYRNAEFIAAARTAVPKLIEQVEFLTQLKWDTASTTNRLEVEIANLNGALGTDRRTIDRLKALLREALSPIEFATKFQNTDSLASRIREALADK